MNETSDLKDISPGGQVPATRLNDPDEVRSLVANEIRNNEKRQKVAALVKGLVDGNPPYKQVDLDKAHQKHRANFNTGEAMSYLSVAMSGVYDLFSEVPSYASVHCELSHPDAPQWGRILTEEFDRLQKQDLAMDYHIQVSQHDMILYGSGPQVWMNTYDWRSRHARYCDVIYPRQTPSDVNDFEYVIFRHRFTTTQLYRHMHNEQAARNAGWDPEVVKSAIIHAATNSYNPWGSDWDQQQQRLRNNDFTHGVNSKTVDVARVVYQEYPKKDEELGKISECWVVINDSLPPGWLLRKLNRFDNWNQCICPFFLDKGDGTAHSVKGLGVRLYKMMLAKMRLDNATVDTAFARSAMMFKATTPKAFANAGMVHMGPYTIMPPELDFVQVQSSGLMDGSMGVSRHLDNQLAANLSQFRQRTMEYQGTPRTATEKQLEAQQQSQLNKTQISRLYQHLDMWYAERYRRAIRTDVDDDMPGQKEAAMFRRRCQMRGVPLEVLRHCKVTATRAVGQGNPWVRINMLESLIPNSMSWPDEGRQNLQKDIIAAKTGMHSVSRYYPEMGQETPETLEQKAEAVQENTSFRVGNTAVWTPRQDNVVHLQIHLEGMAAAVQSLEAGADPEEVLRFIDSGGPNVAAHLERLEADPLRASEFRIFDKQFKELSKVADQLRSQLEQNSKEQAQLAQMANDQQSDQALKTAKQQHDMELDRQKLMHQAALKETKLQHDMALKDAKTAHEITRQGQ